MRKIASIMGVGCITFTIGSCSLISSETKKPGRIDTGTAATPDGNTEMPTNPLATYSGNKASEKKVDSAEDMLKTNPADADNLVFTDPHNPDYIDPTLESAFERRASNTNWGHSYTQALQDANETGMPILVWFHDAKLGKQSIHLAEDILSTSEFTAWCIQNVIRLKYDKRETFEGTKDAAKKKKYVEQAFKSFGVISTPIIYIITPNGSRNKVLHGYKREHRDLTLLQLKAAVTNANREFESYKKTLAPHGYRDWTGISGKKLFGKLSRFDAQTQTVWLQTLDGNLIKTKLSSMIEADQSHIQSSSK